MFGWLRKRKRDRSAYPTIIHTGEIDPKGEVLETYVLPCREYNGNGIGSRHPVRKGYYVTRMVSRVYGCESDGFVQVQVYYN